MDIINTLQCSLLGGGLNPTAIWGFLTAIGGKDNVIPWNAPFILVAAIRFESSMCQGSEFIIMPNGCEVDSMHTGKYSTSVKYAAPKVTVAGTGVKVPVVYPLQT